MTPPLPPDCPFFEDDGLVVGPVGGPTCFSLNTENGDQRIITSAVAFFYWTKEAQRQKKAAQYAAGSGDLRLAQDLMQQHLAAVQAAVGWAKWSGL